LVLIEAVNVVEEVLKDINREAFLKQEGNETVEFDVAVTVGDSACEGGGIKILLLVGENIATEVKQSTAS